MTVALVTGAGRGIGAATAKRLASDGAAVAVIDLREADTAETVDAINGAGGRAIGIGCDVAVTDQVEAAFERTLAELGGLDILVNNAGVIRDNMLFKMTDDDWDTVMGVHLRGAFLCSRAAQRTMVAQRSGKIVNLSSTSALGNRGQANYAAAKAGIQGFTRTLALELSPFGINVNSISPGFIITPMIEETARRMGVPLDVFVKGAAEALPIRRVGTPEDIAGVVSFLVGPDASYITGQNIYVDGGYR
ncbi:3-oxoacyl-ACP reductase [Rhizocola hellebori]|uniref:3-oxoacyl-ACP reductase n=1 Tax=Rhizocola hellebori TaxID=1392758 RepID=A0A8J3QIK8_9ACTN|nr:3-oxoacyl-ACP reductase FabG [Rhizocola hellebori]GIH10414.1 3-oxoacyl-ACP reductase [Rhizocola hellebori]